MGFVRRDERLDPNSKISALVLLPSTLCNQPATTVQTHSETEFEDVAAKTWHETKPKERWKYTVWKSTKPYLQLGLRPRLHCFDLLHKISYILLHPISSYRISPVLCQPFKYIRDLSRPFTLIYAFNCFPASFRHFNCSPLSSRITHWHFL